MRIISIFTLLLLAAVSASAQTTAFVGGRIIDGTGKVIENGTVVITGNTITSVGPASTSVPAGATRVDVKGKTLLPGLINAHGHVGNTVGLRADPQNGHSRENLTRQLRTYAQYGVTTVFSLGDDQETSGHMRSLTPSCGTQLTRWRPTRARIPARMRKTANPTRWPAAPSCNNGMRPRLSWASSTRNAAGM